MNYETLAISSKEVRQPLFRERCKSMKLRKIRGTCKVIINHTSEAILELILGLLTTLQQTTLYDGAVGKILKLQPRDTSSQRLVQLITFHLNEERQKNVQTTFCDSLAEIKSSSFTKDEGHYSLA